METLDFKILTYLGKKFMEVFGRGIYRADTLPLKKLQQMPDIDKIRCHRIGRKVAFKPDMCLEVKAKVIVFFCGTIHLNNSLEKD